MYLIHALYPYDAQRIIDAIPADIRPYVVLNLAMRAANGDGYEVADAWLNTCAQNGIWAMVQPSSGVDNSMSDTDLTNYEKLYQKYPNMVGYNFCEQTWGFDNTSFAQRLGFYCQLLSLADTYGGYLYINDCFSLSNTAWNSISKFKASQDFANRTKTYKANFIFGNKFTHSYGYYDNQSGALGVFLSGHAGNYAVRFDQFAWGWSGRGQVFGVENPTGRMEGYGYNTLLACPEVVQGVPIVEEMLLHGAAVIDGPEVPEYSSIYYNGEQTPTFKNMISDIFRKVLDGTIRIPLANEVATRAKIAYVPMVGVNPPADFYTGLYEMDGQREINRTWFKKTGRYPAIPVLFSNAAYETSMFSSANVVVSSTLSSRWPTQQAKVNEFNSLFPVDSTGDLFAGRFANKWLTYNPYINTDQDANGVLMLKYNTCASLDLTYTAHTLGVVTENAGSISIYLNNYRSDKSQMWADYPDGVPTSQESNYLLHPVDSQLRTSVIKVNGATSQPSFTLTERGSHKPSTASDTWSGGVYTLTINHNGPVDVMIQCSGSATGRPTVPATVTVTAPSAPPSYKVSPYMRVYAVGFSGQSGVDAERYDEIGLNVKSISNGDWIKFSNVDFGSGATGFIARASGTEGGNIELRLDSPSGTLIGTCVVASTGSDHTWKTFPSEVNSSTATGVHDLYLRFTGNSSSSLFKLASWQFGSADTPPFAPDDHTAAVVANGRVLVSWAAVAGATGYNVKRSLNSGGPYITVAAGITGTSHTDTDVSNGVTYYYVISAVNANGEGPDSTEMSLLIQRVLSPVADTYVKNGGSAGSNYGTLPSMEVKYDSTLNSGLTRESFLRFDVSGLASALNAQLRLVPVAADNLNPVINYEFVSDDSWLETGLNWNNQVSGSGEILATSTTCIAGDPIVFDVTNRFRIEAAGDGSLSLRISAPAPGGRWVSFATRENSTISYRPIIEYLLPGPSVPAGLGAAVADNGLVQLAWNAAAGATSYVVKRATNAGGPYAIVASGITTTSHADDSLTGLQSYYYVVSALNAENQSGDSAEAGVVSGGLGTLDASTTVVVGGSTSLTAAAEGNPTPAYHWQISTDGGVNWSYLVEDAHHAGANTATLVITDATPEKHGSRYRYEAANTYGAVTSNATTLTVEAPPAPPAPPVSQQAVTTGHAATFTVTSTGNPAPTYRWQVSTDGGANWVNLTNDTHHDGTHTSSLLVKNATASMSGNRYRCIVENVHGTQTSAAGTLIVAPAHFTEPVALVLDASRNLYVADAASHTIQKITAQLACSPFAGASGLPGSTDSTGTSARFNQPRALVLNQTGDIFVADAGNGSIRKINTNGAVTTLATGFSAPKGIALDAAGNAYVADSAANTIHRVTPDGVVTRYAGTAGQSGSTEGIGAAARFTAPTHTLVDNAGYLFIADTGNHVLRTVAQSGTILIYAGQAGMTGIADGPIQQALLNQPQGMAADSDNNLYFADTGNHTIRMIGDLDEVLTIAGKPGTAGLRDGIEQDALFNQPASVVYDGNGNLYVADTGNAAIRKIVLATGQVTTLVLTTATTTGTNSGTSPSPDTGNNSGGGGGSVSLWYFVLFTMFAAIRLGWRWKNKR
ncbi:hypothetical protein AW736_09110 [Termitidicoccus mucosus]|uniref:Uncharacterized protein n=2 Tax=Termitidicoccus mucosus TaxID=1184151 RepID=A0A178IFY9_9BACT|nr:hypothetical protein AW736_09110 [Opitutaceae bacterium TSB47]